MRKIKSYKLFIEDATATGSSTTGAGAVSPAAIGDISGVGSTPGSGDLGFPLYDKGKGKGVKKGNPSKVTDMRFLEPVKGITKVKESTEWIEFTEDEREIIQDCLLDLTDNGFKIKSLKHDIDLETYDRSEDETASFQDEEIRISLHKMIESNWVGDITIRAKFNKSEIITKKVQTLRSKGEKLTSEEERLFNSLSESTNQMINQLNYQDGYFDIYYQVADRGTSHGSVKINIYVGIFLNRNVYE